MYAEFVIIIFLKGIWSSCFRHLYHLHIELWEAWTSYPVNVKMGCIMKSRLPLIWDKMNSAHRQRGLQDAQVCRI